jgi:hypothetical protein
MTRTTPSYERIKRAYFAFLKEAKFLSMPRSDLNYSLKRTMRSEFPRTMSFG